MFVAGRPHIRAKVRRHLSGRVSIIRLTPRRDGVISYVHSRLDEDSTPDAMGSSLEEDILETKAQRNYRGLGIGGSL